MSVIVAIKENGVIYMGADSQTTKGPRKGHHLNEIGYKIAKIDNGILVGFCGRVATTQTIKAIKDLFTLDADGKLTKKHIVTQVIPKLTNKMQLIGDEETGEIDVSMLLAHQDQLYKISSQLDVFHINQAVSIGAGSDFTTYALFGMESMPVRNRILSALEESTNWVESVDGPFVLIDTKNLQHEIASKGGSH